MTESSPDMSAETLVANLARSAAVLAEFSLTWAGSGELELSHELCLYGEPVHHDITLIELTTVAFAHEEMCRRQYQAVTGDHDGNET